MCRVRRDARSLNVREAGNSRAMETSSRNLNKVRRDAPYGTDVVLPTETPDTDSESTVPSVSLLAPCKNPRRRLPQTHRFRRGRLLRDYLPDIINKVRARVRQNPNPAGVADGMLWMSEELRQAFPYDLQFENEINQDEDP